MQEAHSLAWTWARLAVLAVLLAGTYGTRINDEHDQAAALHNLAHGSLHVRENPPELYRFEGGFGTGTRFPGNVPIGSTLLDCLALPAYVAVRSADAVMPLNVWVTIAAAAIAWSLVPAARRARWVGAAAIVGVLAFGGFHEPGPRLGPLTAIVALQSTNVVLLGATAYLVARTLHRWVPGPGAGVLAAAIVLGPLAYWGGRLKYTLLAALLLAAALWLLGEPRSRARDAALGLVAALAVWNNVGEGMVVAGAVGLALLADAVLPRAGTGPGLRAGLRSLLVPAAALALGLLPWALENQALRGSPLAASYLVPLGQDAGDVQGPWWLHVLRQAFAAELWNGPVDFALNVVGPWTTGWRTERAPLGVFALSPLLAASVAGLLLRRSWKAPDGRAAALAVLLHVALLTNRVVRQGVGMDARLLAPLLPAVGLLAAVALSPWLSSWTSREARTARRAAWAWALAFLAVVGLASSAGILGWGLKVFATDRLLLLGWLGVLVALAGSAWALARARLLPIRPRAVLVVAVGAMASLPTLWLVSATVAMGTSMESDQPPERVRHFLPLAEAAHDAAAPVYGPFRFPVVVENGYTVYSPDHGYCDTEPSPCPWGPRGNATGG